jgi:hypothetical protein
MADEDKFRNRTGGGVRPGWVTARERGTMSMLRVMTLISLKLGRGAGRIAFGCF